MKKRRRHVSLLAGLFFILAVAIPCRAFVYASDLKINGSLTNSWVAPGFLAQITYILNQAATAGATVQILAGTNVIKSFTATNGQPGTLAGTNEFSWDGTDNHGSNVAPGLFTLQVAVGAVGFNDWTNITDDDSNFTVLYPTGIDVNKNTNSPYYGRVFVSDASANAGIYKFNADGSPADEGGFNTGGWPWSPALGVSPWKIAIGANDRVYVNDWVGEGTVLAFDEEITNYEITLNSSDYPTNAVNLTGPYVTGSATNEAIWMADYEQNGTSLGILRWSLQADGIVGDNTNGTCVVAATNSDLGDIPYDVAVAANGAIFTVQDPRASTNSPVTLQPPAVLCFPSWTNGAPPETRALWSVGAADTNFFNPRGVDVNPAATLVAVAVQGWGHGIEGNHSGGNLTILSATNGALVKRFAIALGQGFADQFLDVAWDAVGNVYATDLDASVWRVYSPPGPNQATTTAVGQILALSSLQPPELYQPGMTTNGFGVWLHGQPDVNYAIQISTDLTNWTGIETNFDTVADRFIGLPLTADTQDFYRAVVARNP